MKLCNYSSVLLDLSYIKMPLIIKIEKPNRNGQIAKSHCIAVPFLSGYLEL